MLAAHIIGGDQFAGLEDRTNFTIEKVKGRRGKFFRRNRLQFCRKICLLGLKQDIDGQMARVRNRPVENRWIGQRIAFG